MQQPKSQKSGQTTAVELLWLPGPGYPAQHLPGRLGVLGNIFPDLLLMDYHLIDWPTGLPTLLLLETAQLRFRSPRGTLEYHHVAFLLLFTFMLGVPPPTPKPFVRRYPSASYLTGGARTFLSGPL